MNKVLLFVAGLLLATGSTASRCEIDGVSVPEPLESVVTSLCSEVLRSTTASPTALPSPLREFWSHDRELSSFCSCELDHSATTTGRPRTTSQSQVSQTASTSSRAPSTSPPSQTSSTSSATPSIVSSTSQSQTSRIFSISNTIVSTVSQSRSSSISSTLSSTNSLLCSHTATITVSITQQHCTPTSITTAAPESTVTNTVFISKTAPATTVTRTDCLSASTITRSTSTVTVSETVSTATITRTACNATSAATLSETAPRTTITVTASGSGCTGTLSETATVKTVTITANVSVVTVSQSASAKTITVTANASTITVTATPSLSSASSSRVSTSSTAPTGPPICTQATTPAGNCAYAADYNSGTSPQLWAGQAASLDACALLCAGEPGCLSLAYNPGGSLQCVLFNTKVGGLTTTSDAGSATSFFDNTCFTCSGSTPPRPQTDDSCTPSLQPPAGALCNSPEISAGVPLFIISSSGNTAPSLGACTQQCLANSACQSLSFDGTNCQLLSQSVIQLELGGIVFPVNPGVAGSVPYYDRGCYVCPVIACTCPPPVSKRELSRREVGVERREMGVGRREAELERRLHAVTEWERELAKHR